MTTIYLSAPGSSSLEVARTWDWDTRPLSILVSYAYLKQWALVKPYFKACNLMLDSGAYTVKEGGAAIDIDGLIEAAKDPQWTEVVSLDVIGDGHGSRVNFDYMLANGCARAMPVFHLGDPWELLDYYCKTADKVGVGGIANLAKRPLFPWLDQVFARAWPKKLHGFGISEFDTLVRYPFHSADASTWIIAPSRFKNWLFKKRGRYVQKHLSVETHGANGRKIRDHGIRNHLEAMYRVEQQLKARWASTLAPLNEAP